MKHWPAARWASILSAFFLVLQLAKVSPLGRDSPGPATLMACAAFVMCGVHAYRNRLGLLGAVAVLGLVALQPFVHIRRDQESLEAVAVLALVLCAVLAKLTAPDQSR